MNYWLLKTEPETYSFERLLKERKTHWNGVRNFQARNYLSQIRVGDLAFIYHSVSQKAVIGIAKVVRAAYSDPDPERKGEWVQVDIEAVSALKRPVSLEEIKKISALKDLPLLKQSRLSVMPISAEAFKLIQKLGGQAC